MIKSGRYIVWFVSIQILFGVFFVGSTPADNAKKADNSPSAYAGSPACRECHSEIYDLYIESGHAHMLKKVVNSTAPTYPNTMVKPPPGTTWKDISYVVGGHGWRAEFLDRKGYFITGDSAAYFVETQKHEPFKTGQKHFGYSFCPQCHTTGHRRDTTNKLPGVSGTWAEAGIGCELCHGPADNHISAANDDNDDETRLAVNTDITGGFCDRCHTNAGVKAKEGFLVPAQYDELGLGEHEDLECVDCHDPHKSAKYDKTAIIQECTESCHKETTVRLTEHSCRDCHMPYIVKMAVKKNKYTADMRSHIFAIETDTTEKMFETPAGNWQTEVESGITLDYACLGCHPSKSLAWAAEKIAGIHD